MAEGWLWLGAVLAALLSWTANASIVWAVMHAVLGWIYVIYWVLFAW